jgi:hypothetical protein
MLNPEHRLVLSCFKRMYRPEKTSGRVLDLSRQSIPFKDIHKEIKIKTYFEPQCTRLPYENQSFDFVFNRERDMSRMFISPLTGLNELMRTSKRGIIQHSSPLEVLLMNKDVPYLTWTEPYLNRLCVIPYQGPVSIKNKSQWLDLVNYNYLYMNNFYSWTNPMEMNIQTFFGNELEYTEYTELLNNAIEQSAEHTRLFLEQYSEPKQD